MPQAKILVIDDERLTRTMLSDLIRAKGYAVVTAEDGASGLAAAQREKPNVIILDVMMAGMDGFAVCEMLKKDAATARIPVVILTASDDPHLTKKAFNAGAAFTLAKTSKPERILNTLHLAVTLTPPT